MLKKINKRPFRKQTIAVSEVVGTILILLISVSIFSVVYTGFFTIGTGDSSPPVTITGSIENNEIILEHRGGKPLSLSTKIIISPENTQRQEVTLDDSDTDGEFVNVESKADGQWNIGEKFIYRLKNHPGYNRFDSVEIKTIDVKTNSIIMKGTFKEEGYADICINPIEISNNKPNLYDKIILTINVENNGPITGEGIVIKDKIEKGLKYLDIKSISQGNYLPDSGRWEIGQLNKNTQAKIDILAEVIPLPSEKFTQLTIILDGSSKSYDWLNMLKSIKTSINHGIIPHNGLVELTIIQYGDEPYPPSIPCKGFARTEASTPVILDQDNYEEIAAEVLNIQRLGGKSPLCSGLNLARISMATSTNFNVDNNQKIIALISNMPDCELINENSVYSTETDGYNAKISAKNVRDRIILDLSMDAQQDEIDVAIIDHIYQSNQDDSPWDHQRNILWLCNDIAWYGSDFYDFNSMWPPTDKGWVRRVDIQQEIQLLSCYDTFFEEDTPSERTNTAKVIESNTPDNNPANDEQTIVITVGG